MNFLRPASVSAYIMIRWSLHLWLVLLVPTLAAVGQTRSDRFDELVSHYSRAGFLNGVVLVGEHGKVVYARGVGEADTGTHAANTPQTKFGIASITKQFTAALVLQQVEQGRIRLNASISEYLPWYRQDTGRRITIEQLLHHTSGLPPDYDAPAFNATTVGEARMEPRPFAEKYCEADLTADPGTKWQYSNCGYDILGLVLEQVTGVAYGDLLRRNLLEPSGMRDSGLDREDLALRGRALGYERHFGPRYVRGPHMDVTHIYAAGGMYSTAEDLFRWNQVLSSDAVLSKKIRDEIFRPGLADWGYGWFVTRIPAGQPGSGNTLAEMRGDMPGNFFCSINRYPDQDAVIIVLRNGYGSTERLEANLQTVLFGQIPHVPMRNPAEVALGALRSRTGCALFVVSLAAVGIVVIGRRRRRRVVAKSA